MYVAYAKLSALCFVIVYTAKKEFNIVIAAVAIVIAVVIALNANLVINVYVVKNYQMINNK